jgi:hypothetical protein
MFGFALCGTAILSVMLCARRSLATGLIVVLTWGYAYGIIRAKLASLGSYFIFDAAMVGLYLSR